MNDVLLLLSPRWKRFRLRLRDPNKEKVRFPFVIGLVLVLWVVIYVVFYKALEYFTTEEVFGTIVAVKLLSMILLTFAFVVIISNVITTFSTFFLSEDLELIMAGPVSAASLYSERFIETLADSSWMVLVFGFPVFLAYGTVFAAPWTFYALSALGFASLLMMATAISIFLVQTLVRVFPIRRLRDLFIFVGLLVFVGIYLLFRMIRPEEFLNPEGFASVMDYLSIMSEPSSPLLPTTWLVQILQPYITGHGFDERGLYLALLVVGALAMFRLAGHYHEAVHFPGYSKAMESKGARLSRSRFLAVYARALHRFLDRPTAMLVMKETMLLARDTGRLSQLLLLAALILVYLYNFTVLPSLDSPWATALLKNTVAFLNIGLAGFVLSSLGVRFLFPALSSEGRAYWILKSCPVNPRKILWVKFCFYLVPMVVLGLFLVVMTNYLLGLKAFMFMMSTVTVLLLTVGVTSLSIGMGVLHAEFRETDPSRAFTGFGALMTMIYGGLAVAAVILLEAVPVWRVIRADLFGRPLLTIDYAVIALGFTGAFIVAMFLIIRPMKSAFRRIAQLEP